jgi:hypothetical protein
MIKYEWRRNETKDRWELWYIGRKREKPIFVCLDKDNIYKYFPISDNPQSPFCGGFYGHSLVDRKPCSSWNCITDSLVQVVRNEDERDNTPLDVRVFRPSDRLRNNPIYIGLPK